jgi:hypothetical protein
MICDAFLSEVTLCDVWPLKARFAEHAAACSSFAYRHETRVNSASNSSQMRTNNGKGRRRALVMLQRLVVLAQTDFPKGEFAFGRCHDAKDVT